MPYKNCKICSKEFYAKQNWINRGNGLYCSRKCQHESQKKGKIIKCFICKKETYKSFGRLKHSKSGKYFCNKSCQTIWRNSIVHIEKNHPNWKNGESSYRDIILRKDVQRFCRRCKIADMRVLIVHHLDKNRKNNDPHNLIWLCCNCHFLIHHNKNEMREFMEALV